MTKTYKVILDVILSKGKTLEQIKGFLLKEGFVFQTELKEDVWCYLRFTRIQDFTHNHFENADEVLKAKMSILLGCSVRVNLEKIKEL